jgi:hypothetical protein
MDNEAEDPKCPICTAPLIAHGRPCVPGEELPRDWATGSDVKKPWYRRLLDWVSK